MLFPVAIWTQNHDPLSSVWLSAAVAAIPVVFLFYLLAVRKIRAHMAAVYAFLVSILLAALVFKMPPAMLCLIANTAPVAFGGVGNPIRALVAVTGLGEADLSAMIGRILPWTAMLLPFWLVRSMTTWSNTFAVWPGLAVCGGVFAAIQFYWSNFRDAALVDITGGMVTLIALTLFLKAWKPSQVWRYPGEPPRTDQAHAHTAGEVLHAWSPFLLLAALVIVWGIPKVKKVLDTTSFSVPVPGLHMQVMRVPPVVDKVEYQDAKFDLNWLSAVGTATFFAG